MGFSFGFNSAMVVNPLDTANRSLGALGAVVAVRDGVPKRSPNGVARTEDLCTCWLVTIVTVRPGVAAGMVLFVMARAGVVGFLELVGIDPVAVVDRLG